MRTITTFILTLFTSVLFSQEQFTYNESGLTPAAVVVDIEGKTQDEIFQKAIDWIKETYKNPDEVIKTTIGNEKARFEGVDMRAMCHIALGSTTCYPTTYTIEIEFKEGRYRFNPLSITYRIPSTAYTPEVTNVIDFESGEAYYNKRGKLRSVTREVPPSVELLLNGLNSSLSNYINETGSTNDW